MHIDTSLTFEQIVNDLMTLKTQYKEKLASFLWYEYREKNDFVYDLKLQIYSLNFAEWKKDKIWNYLNDSEFLSVIKHIIDKNKKK